MYRIRFFILICLLMMAGCSIEKPSDESGLLFPIFRVSYSDHSSWDMLFMRIDYDGIRESTWPGAYNRSRIIGRTDYFVMPDWYCYTVSGQQVRFNMPDEKWNYIEISGGADGQITLTPNKDGSDGKPYFIREKGIERSFHRMETPITGQTLVFTNNMPETPIGEFDAFYVHEGDAPVGIARLTYSLSPESSNLSNPNIAEVLQYIRGRHPSDERTTLAAVPGSSASRKEGVSLWAHLQLEYLKKYRHFIDVIDIVDGLLAHAVTTPDGQVKVHHAIHFDTDECRPSGMGNPAPGFRAAWRWIGNDKYFAPLLGSMSSVNSNMLDIASMRPKMEQQLGEPYSEFSRQLAWQLTGNKKYWKRIIATFWKSLAGMNTSIHWDMCGLTVYISTLSKYNAHAWEE